MDPIHSPEGRTTTLIRLSVATDAAELAPSLREADGRELKSLCGMTPLQGLELSYENSVAGTCFTGFVDDKPACMWGLGAAETLGVAHPWLLASDLIEEVPMTFLRHSVKVVKAWAEMYPLLTNVADPRNTLHLKWLDFLGFKQVKVWPEYGIDKSPFIQFIRTAKCVSLYSP